MIGRIIAILSAFIVATISSLGYAGIVLLMAIEFACIPLPSEIIMPFAGYLVYTGQFNLFCAPTAGTVGCNIRSIIPIECCQYGGCPTVADVVLSIMPDSSSHTASVPYFSR